MPNGYKRTDRVADQIRKDLAGIIQREVKDPRLGLVTINDVRITKDLAYADVFFTCFAITGDDESEKHIAEVEQVLQKAASFLRHQLGQGLKIRVTPELRFQYDHVIERGMQMDTLITQARKKDSE